MSIDELLSIIDSSKLIKKTKVIRDIRKGNFDFNKNVNQKIKLLGT